MVLLTKCQICGEKLEYTPDTVASLGVHATTRHPELIANHFPIEIVNLPKSQLQKVSKDTKKGKKKGATPSSDEEKSDNSAKKAAKKEKKKKEPKKKGDNSSQSSKSSKSGNKSNKSSKSGEKPSKSTKSWLKSNKTSKNGDKSSKSSKSEGKSNKSSKSGEKSSKSSKNGGNSSKSSKSGGNSSTAEGKVKVNEKPSKVKAKAAKKSTKVKKKKVQSPKKTFKTTVETWKPGMGDLTCPVCGQTGTPLLRRKRNMIARTQLGALCMFSCWPLCFLPFLCGKSSKYNNVYCSYCDQFLGQYNNKTKILTPPDKVKQPPLRQHATMVTVPSKPSGPELRETCLAPGSSGLASGILCPDELTEALFCRCNDF